MPRSGVPVVIIQALVAKRFGVLLLDMTSARQSRAIARARQLAMYLARRHTALSLPAIGRHFGNRDHSTVLYACRAIEGRLALDPDLAAAVASLEARLIDSETPNLKEPPDV